MTTYNNNQISDTTTVIENTTTTSSTTITMLNTTKITDETDNQSTTSYITSSTTTTTTTITSSSSSSSLSSTLKTETTTTKIRVIGSTVLAVPHSNANNEAIFLGVFIPLIWIILIAGVVMYVYRNRIPFISRRLKKNRMLDDNFMQNELTVLEKDDKKKKNAKDGNNYTAVKFDEPPYNES
jgi:hypothetical protein